MPRKGKPDLKLWAATMIDLATGWFEIAEAPNTERADIMANMVEQLWSCRCLWPQQAVMDRGTEFMAEFSKMTIEEHGLEKKTMTKRNPQANSIVE